MQIALLLPTGSPRYVTVCARDLRLHGTDTFTHAFAHMIGLMMMDSMTFLPVLILLILPPLCSDGRPLLGPSDCVQRTRIPAAPPMALHIRSGSNQVWNLCHQRLPPIPTGDGYARQAVYLADPKGLMVLLVKMMGPPTPHDDGWMRSQCKILHGVRPC